MATVSRKHRTEYLALRAVAAITGAMPYRLAMGSGRLLADASFVTVRYRRDEACRRVRLVFGDRYDEGRILAICRESWRNTVLNGIEMMRVAKTDLAWARRHCACDAYIETIKKALAAGRGVLLACPHMGSWEMASVVSRLHGIPIFSIGARQKNPLVDAYMHRLRQRPGIEIIARGDGAMKEAIAKLRCGQALGILPDVRAPQPGYLAPFLGGQANIHKGIALFARRSGCPVYPVVARREGLSRHTLTVHEPVAPDPGLPTKQDGLRMTQHIMTVFDRAIRESPGQWFWYNKRWILDPL